MSNNYALWFSRIELVVIPSYIELTWWKPIQIYQQLHHFSTASVWHRSSNLCCIFLIEFFTVIKLKLNWLIISSLLNSNFLFFWQIYRPITPVSVKWNSQTFFWSFFDWVNFYMNFPSYQSFLKTFILVIWTGGNYLVVFDNYITASDVRHESNPFSCYIFL